jgi:hypothetical protein
MPPPIEDALAAGDKLELAEALEMAARAHDQDHAPEITVAVRAFWYQLARLGELGFHPLTLLMLRLVVADDLERQAASLRAEANELFPDEDQS